MSEQILDALLEAVAAEIGMADAAPIVAARSIEVQGFECSFEVPESDGDALYLLFDFGITTAGRTLRLYTAMLEANLTTYAQDQAQLGIDAGTGVVILIVRIPGLLSIDATWLADTLIHYAEHGLYWRDTIFQSSDEMFEGVSRGDFEWIRA
jgi:Tir chaperone protein (CesT) family